MERIKCITFDKAAQDNLPQHIKDKMKADREKAIKQQEKKGLNIPVVVKRYSAESIVKYIDKNGSRTFNCGQALKDGWGKDWKGEKELIGLKLQDRKKANHKVEISNVDWYIGTLRVWFKEGGWLCFDHAIEQFKCVS